MSKPTPQLKRVALALRNVEPARLETLLTKGSRLSIRVSETEKQSMLSTASRLNMSLSDYVLHLHREARAALDAREQRGRKGR